LSKIIGIDLGTWGSAAGAIVGGRPVLIPNAEGMLVEGKPFPSVVAFLQGGKTLVGEAAKRQAVANPTGTIEAIKRKMGTNYRVQITGKRGRFLRDVSELSPEQISAMILLRIKHDSEIFLQDTITKAVITVPAYFNINQRQATKDAATIAGLEVVRLINESTASALGYCFNRLENRLKIMVFELGAGSFGVTIMEMSRGGPNDPPLLEVLSTGGDNQLGGIDMDNSIIHYFADQCFFNPMGIRGQAKRLEAVDGTSSLGRYVRQLAERAKIELSTLTETQIIVPTEWCDETISTHLTLSRQKLDELVGPVLERCRVPMDTAVKDAKLTRKDIDRIILVGGPTRMPQVRRFVEDYMGKEAERGIDPMACAAIGAATQAGVIAGEIQGLLLLDVIPMSLGVETLGAVFTGMIKRNSPIPTIKRQIFSTTADNQKTVKVHVLQGERPMAADNVSLGEFALTEIPPAPRGTPKIEVTFDIDANGILNVSAKDLDTNRIRRVILTASARLSEYDIDAMTQQVKKLASVELSRDEERQEETTKSID
jgi:molecular chaperone DnaK